ncbi:Uncharacterised protein [Mycobacteroides abscessus subsp. abscessus]|nr:Uncharacterised protein [Mycobacteroides abscessus subsp. abscessus]
MRMSAGPRLYVLSRSSRMRKPDSASVVTMPRQVGLLRPSRRASSDSPKRSVRCCARKSSTAITRSVGGEVLPAPLSRSSTTMKPPVPVRRSPTFLTYPVAAL